MAKIENEHELFVHELGATVTMEETIVEMLEELEGKANAPKLKELLRHHREETERQRDNLDRAFAALGHEVDKSSCPAIEGIEKGGKANLKMVDDSLNDSVILSGAADTEHHEISVYEGLITKAEAMGHEDVVALLRENLEQEEHTLREIEQMTQQHAREHAHAA